MHHAQWSSHPDGLVVVFEQTVDALRWQNFSFAMQGNILAIKNEKPGVFRPYPRSAVGTAQYRAHPVGKYGKFDRRESEAVKYTHAFIGSYPDVTGRIGINAVDEIIGQS